MSKKKSQLSPGDKQIRFDSPPTLPSKAPLSVPRTKKGTFPEKKNSVGAIFLKKRNVLLLLVLSPPNVFMRFRRLSRLLSLSFPLTLCLVSQLPVFSLPSQKIPGFLRNSRKICSRSFALKFSRILKKVVTSHLIYFYLSTLVHSKNNNSE